MQLLAQWEIQNMLWTEEEVLPVGWSVVKDTGLELLQPEDREKGRQGWEGHCRQKQRCGKRLRGLAADRKPAGLKRRVHAKESGKEFEKQMVKGFQEGFLSRGIKR